MQANNLTQLVGLLMQVVAFCYVFLTGLKWTLERWHETQTTKYQSQLEQAKANTLSATQVADLIKQIYNFKNELEEIKHDGKLKTDALVKSIDRMEELLDVLTQKFTDFLISKAK